ncbi:phosphatase PAP2 family protein [Sphingomonas sp. UV9]|uniref:acid phosphatase n=1 Tax=Sphingomonas sp. UV9 TaxID=1851410 RepID=UPI000FFC0096|nr:phosphatase PAP2 family protein [Sphingomonas sp. UV9]RXD02355.1 phosphatase PAP2 family protein [Sphingomonas sp. UV9]
MPRPSSANAVLAATLTALCLGGGAALARVERTEARSGYLAPGAFDVLAVLPPAPRPGDPRATADRAVFRATRAFAGTARWAMATNDVKLAPVDMMRDYSCAVGIVLTPQMAPRTAMLIARASSDTARGTGIAKNFYKRQRPFLIDQGATCQPAAEVADSYDYPSGHTTAGWTWATLLAELAPDRATPILARGRAFGESRLVCGVHNASAVEAGRLSASATLTAERDVTAFKADLAAARVEMDALRRNPTTPKPAPALCSREAALIAQRID